MTASDTTLIPPLHNSDFTTQIANYQRFAKQTNSELIITSQRCNCSTCPTCRRIKRRQSANRKIKQLSKPASEWHNPVLITFAPKNLKTHEIKTLLTTINKLKTSLLKKQLIEPDYIAAIEVGESGKVHAHIAVSALATTDELRNAIHKWTRRSGVAAFNSKNCIIDITYFETSEKLVSYVCKDKTPAEYEHLLPSRRISVSQSLNSKVQKRKPAKPKNRTSQSVKSRTRKSLNPATKITPNQCGKHAVLRIAKRGTSLPICPDLPLPIDYSVVAYYSGHCAAELRRTNQYDLDYPRHWFAPTQSDFQELVQEIQMSNGKHIAGSYCIPGVVLRALRRAGFVVAEPDVDRAIPATQIAQPQHC